jgi:NADH-quinone oxidoreductase subunit N
MNTVQSLSVALPEILLFVGVSVVLLADVLFNGPQIPRDEAAVHVLGAESTGAVKRDAASIANGTGAETAPRLSIERMALAALILPLLAVCLQADEPTRMAFSGMYVADALATLLKGACIIAVGMTIVYAGGYAADRGLRRGEFYALALFSLLGEMVMISAANLLVVYIGLELMTLSLYALVAMRRDHTQSTEAAMKYFVLGAIASGFLLYGMSMLYGGTGSLDIATIAKALNGGVANRTVIIFGVVFVVAALAFKFGAVPFHMWVPDVYHGAPTAATLLIAGAPKLAAFGLAFRLLAEGLVAVQADWQGMLQLLAIASLALGNFVAIAQTNLKRVLAYSTIAQIGFVLLGFSVGSAKDGIAEAWGSSAFYIVSYVLTTLGTFGVILLAAAKGFECDRLEDLRGLARRAPGLAFTMLLLMFSLAGIPPTVGFYAKLSVLQSVVVSGQVGLAVAAVMLSLVGAFYYLRVVKVMYFDAPTDQPAVSAPEGARALLAINGAAILVLGILPGPLMSWCGNAIRQSLGS